VQVKDLSGEARNNQTQLFTGQFNCVQSGWLIGSATTPNQTLH
jgi:hypothetical protein